MKIKIDKKDKIFYDAENGLLSSGHWAVKLGPEIEISDPAIAALISAGKSFTINGTYGRGPTVPDFESRIPNIKSIMEGWKRCGLLRPISFTKWAYRSYAWKSNGWLCKYAPEDNSFSSYFQEKYSEMIQDLGGDAKTVDGKSAAYVFDKDGEAIAVVMPVEGPEEAEK